jgi:hypothetical protein
MEKACARFDSSGGPDACWPWRGARDRKGYGQVVIGQRPLKAHRVAFFVAHGHWPEPCCCHTCDNPPCGNPKHLFEGTHADNAADRDAKGRRVAPRGDAHARRRRPELSKRRAEHPMAKLTEQQVRDIRANYALCRVTTTTLGERYGVSATQIGRIIRGLSWSNGASAIART